MGADGDWYEQRAVSASGAVGSWSKRQRLDVGVILHCFLLVLVIRLVGFSGFLSELSFGWIGWLKFSVGSWVKWFVFGELVESLGSGFQVDSWPYNLGWVCGGGGC
jgi:hypothetical protein